MAPITILIVDKTGSIKETSIKKYDESELYKKAGLKTAVGFKCYAEWNIEDVGDKSYCVSVFGKTDGKANQENKYDFPPPIDSTLFFGSCIIVNKQDGVAVSITEEEWEDIYQYLFGGFEDLGDEDTEDEEDDDEEEGPRTKSGYLKDNFVVDDDEIEDEEEEEEEDTEVDEDDDEEVYSKKSKSSKKTKTASKKKGEKVDKKTKKVASSPVLANVFTELEPQTYLDCTSELSEEEYV
jgi:hypothetical protein